MHCVFSCFFTIYVFLFKIGQASDSIHWHHRGARGETHALNTTVWQLDGSCARKWADLKCRSNAKSKLPVTCAHKTGWTSLRIQIQHISNQFSENKTLDQPSWQSCRFPEQAGVLHTNHPSQTCYHTNYWKVPDSSTGPSTHHLKELDNGGIPGFLSTMSFQNEIFSSTSSSHPWLLLWRRVTRHELSICQLFFEGLALKGLPKLLPQGVVLPKGHSGSM